MLSITPSDQSTNNPYPEAVQTPSKRLKMPVRASNRRLRTKPQRSLDTKGSNYPSRYSLDLRRQQRDSFFSAMGRSKFPNKTMRLCGSGLVFGGDTVEFKNGKHGARVAGLATCKNHLCPFCAVKKEAEHIERIEAELNTALKEKRDILFSTATAGFYVSSCFRDRQKALSDALYNTGKQIAKKWKHQRVRRIEFTINPDKLRAHYHIHSLIVFDDDVCEIRSEIEKDFWKHWNREIRKFKCVKSVDRKAQDYRWVETNNELAKYIAKTCAYEISDRTAKVGQGGSSMSWLQWVQHSVEAGFGDEERRFALKILHADFKVQTITFTKGWATVEEDSEDKDIDKKEKTFAELNRHGASAFLRFHHKGWNSKTLLKELHQSDLARNWFAQICWDNNNVLEDNPFDFFLVKQRFTSDLKELVEFLQFDKRPRHDNY
jgi:hypothetical protein